MSHCRLNIWKICKCNAFPTDMRAAISNSWLLHMSVLHSVTMPGIWCLNGTLRDIRLLTVMLYYRPWAPVNRDTHKSLKIAVVRVLHTLRTSHDNSYVLVSHKYSDITMDTCRHLTNGIKQM